MIIIIYIIIKLKLQKVISNMPIKMKEDRRRDNRYNKSEDFIAGITNMYVNVRGGCMWPSARWMISLAGMVEL